MHEINIKAFCFNPFRENTYLMWNRAGECILVDPSPYTDDERDSLFSYISDKQLKPKEIWLTHGHFDHVYGVAPIVREYSTPVRMHPDDKVILENDHVFAASVLLDAPDCSFETVDLADGEILDALPDSLFKVIWTPGHTPGSVCFLDSADKVMLSGDTLFAGTIGRTDHMGGDYDREIVSVMDKLMGLPGDIDVLPGHGGMTSIADERTHNPFLQPFNEPETEILP
ncbi:MAG: MBL fold metallo-hydrolase [Bacteroidales bacterium]|nr:MBL fold metallo-hydrolase [Bacteroidales bacterium]